MKNLYLILILLPLVLVNPAEAQKVSKEERAAQEAEAFRKIQELIAGKQFQVEINRVYPQSGFDVSRFNPTGKITVNDTTAQGHLPFFGRAYSLPYHEGGGIEFNDIMKEVTIKTIEKRKKKAVIFSFSVRGNNDTYQFVIEVTPNGGCAVNLNSNNRTQISYGGNISPYEEK